MLVPRNSLSSYEPALNTSATPVSCLEITLDAGNTTFDPTATDVDEAYSLSIGEDGIAKLSSKSTFGILHGLETFSQLFYEHSAGDAWYLVNAPIEIEDSPVYGHRGLMLDTARHWFPVDDIKRTIDGLSYNKLNKLHVHVTDSQSWPLEIPSIPELTAKGAHSQSSVYSPDDIKSIQEYGVARGVEVYFEIDMPGHIGVVGEAFPDLVVAYDARPYFFYCAQPPCGAFRLNDSNVETFLGNLFDDILPRVAPYSKYWGTGGDELNANDSRFDPGLNTNDSAVLQPLLQTFVDNQHTRVRNAGLTPTVWEELVTEWNVTLGKDVVVQSWLGGGAVAEIASKGHKVIDSNYNFWVSPHVHRY
jgi:hexosaminidase